MLATGRSGEALEELRSFAALRKDGLIPNCFDDGSGEARYNTADASLWFVHAACEFVRCTDDVPSFRKYLMPACEDVVSGYAAGTRFGIGVDPADGLLRAGDASTQLTWMDAQRDGVIFTPRHGKPVELSALWYNALRSLAWCVRRSEGDHARWAAEYDEAATAVAERFEKTFWNERERCLWDVAPADPERPPEFEMRPNQIFAVSLPHSPLPVEKRRSVLEAVRAKLVTPVGLRTLSSSHPQYRARMEGTLFERDRAYHNGTVWPWLFGPFCEAEMRIAGFSAQSRRRVLETLRPLLNVMLGRHVEGQGGPAPIRQIAEVYDAEGTAQRPRRADGCPAQAWSVGEALRVMVLALKSDGGDGAE
jgi:predicted glycogen debranching enzyme